MPEYVDLKVTALRDSNSDDEITLLLGVSGNRDEFAKRAEHAGASVHETLGQATLRVSALEFAVDRLCELTGLKSIEIERDDVRMLNQRSGPSRRRVTRSENSDDSSSPPIR